MTRYILVSTVLLIITAGSSATAQWRDFYDRNDEPICSQENVDPRCYVVAQLDAIEPETSEDNDMVDTEE